jgi:hypothetical protein
MNSYRNIPPLPLVAILAISAMAQQTPSTSQPTSTTQVQTAPCTTGQSSNATPQNNKSGSSLADRWKKKINDESAKLATRTGVPMPTTGDLNSAGTTKPAPCPTKASAPAAPTTQPAPVLHLPNGVTTTWLCNPIVTSTDPSHTTTFITPDELTNAEPAQPSAFEADAAKADPKATVSCANLRRDPKNNKVFLAQ